MLETTDYKKCPFRPIKMCKGNFYNNGMGSEWKETITDFEYCIDEKCMIYDKNNYRCGFKREN